MSIYIAIVVLVSFSVLAICTIANELMMSKESLFKALDFFLMLSLFCWATYTVLENAG